MERHRLHAAAGAAMTYMSSDLLQDYLDGRLDDDRAEIVEQALREIQTCPSNWSDCERMSDSCVGGN